MENQTSRTSKPPPLKPLQSPDPSSIKTQYLILYNFVSFLLWLVVLGRVVGLVPLVGWPKVYAGVGVWVKWVQTGMVIEVVHALVGLISSPFLTTTMQVSSRLLLVWLVIDPFPSLAHSPAYSTMLLAWSLTEVIRYSYFTLTLSGFRPRFWTWLRYSGFLLLYPLGIGSECLLIFRAVPLAKGRRQEYAWFLQAVLGIYVPGSYILFTYMLAQRRKVMRSLQSKKEE